MAILSVSKGRDPGFREPTGEPASASRTRRGYLDWVRGLAVLIMIEAHVVDSWTGVPDRFSQAFAWAMVVGGFGAPLFLFLAGVAVSLSAGSKSRRLGDDGTASRAVMRRGLEIFLLAFVFRFQAWILGWSSPRFLLRVDILNVMGPSIVMAAALWPIRSTLRGRAAVFAVATLATTFLTPIIRSAAFLGRLPDPLESYLRPAGPLASFSLFPWAGFVFAGALIGVWLDSVRPDSAGRAWSSSEGRLNIGFLVGGAVLAVGAYAASFLAAPYARSDFWTSSPSFFLLRLGLLTTAIGVAYVWEKSWGNEDSWSPVRQLGRTSLFIYWIHVEMVYGLISLPLHHLLTLRQTWLALALFSLFMLACSIGKDRAVAWWGTRRLSRTGNAPPILPSSL
jgi:uncharacterized membrane protein